MEAPPTAAALRALDTDAWSVVVALVRPVLRDLPDTARTPALVRLAALPTSRLAGGTGRRRLAEAIAAGGPVWVGLRESLSAHDDVVGALVDAAERPRAAEPTPPSVASAPDTTVRELRSRVKHERRRREDAERRLVAAEARADAECARRASTVADRDRLLAEKEQLEERVRVAAEERRSAEERTARRVASDRAEDRDELRRLRRELDELRRVRALAATQAVTSSTASPVDESDQGSGPARPTILPDVLRPSRDIADLLVGPGRTVLVDGWNVSQRHRGQLSKAEQRRWLTDACATLAVRQRAEVDVYFDAPGGPRREGAATRRGRVRVVFPPQGISVDDDVVLRIAAAPPEEPFTVVTDDADLAQRVRAERADVLETVAFVWLLG